jgi:hypothetical protein
MEIQGLNFCQANHVAALPTMIFAGARSINRIPDAR